MRTLLIACLALLLAPTVQAQFIDCSGGCTEDLYGLGNDSPDGPFLHSVTIARDGPGDGSCGGPPEGFRFQGQLRIREQDSCVVSPTTRCPVEIPQVAADSIFFNVNRATFDLGPLGILTASGAGFSDMSGNLGQRQLSGTCTLDAGEECALDSDCPSGAGCLSTCFSEPGTSCGSHADCPAADCRTEIGWDGIGLCTDLATACTSDADCSGGACLAGFSYVLDPASCRCCQSSLGVVCAGIGRTEYPAVQCGAADPRQIRLATPHLLFDGGRGTRFEHETIQVSGQQEGVCSAGDRSRPCGALGDFWAGSANGKCQGQPPCIDPFDSANPAIGSGCDDVAFGGVAGDFCDLSENGIRHRAGTLVNADGTQNATLCGVILLRLVGIPNELCAVANDIPDGDPQPGCALINLGVVAQPDFDCNGVDDTEEGRCMSVGGAFCSDPDDCPPCVVDADCVSGNCINNGDLCDFLGEGDSLLDSNNDDIGDECQCADGNGDGAISGIDISAVALCANGVVACDATLVDATGDNATTAEDIGGVVSVVNGSIQTSALECLRNLDTTVP